MIVWSVEEILNRLNVFDLPFSKPTSQPNSIFTQPWRFEVWCATRRATLHPRLVDNMGKHDHWGYWPRERTYQRECHILSSVLNNLRLLGDLGKFQFYKKKIQQRCHEEIIIDGWNFKRAFSHKSQRIQTKPIGYTTHVRPRRICRSLQTVSCLVWGGWIMGQLGHVASQFPIFKWWMSHSEL